MKWILFFFTIFVLPNYSFEIKEKKLNISSGKIYFFSEAPQETIKGIGKLVSGKVEMDSKLVKLEIQLKDWKTSSSLQTRHLQENYLETDKFPVAEFLGKIDSLDLESGKVKLTGAISLHGKKKEGVVILGTLSPTQSGYKFISDFSILLTDFDIKVPQLLILKVNNEIKLKAELEIAGE